MTLRLPRGLAPLLAVLALSSCASAPPALKAAGGPPQSMLWVGNSFFYYNNSMHNHVAGLVRGGDKSVLHRGVSVTISGSGVDWHDIGNYLSGGIGRYTFQADNSIKFNPPGKQFDAVIFMDCSQCPIHPQLKDTFHEYARKNAETIRAYGAAPILFMSWAYKDKPEMTAQLAEAYVAAGREFGMQVVPAGLAFAKSIARKPDLELYAPDKRHPSLAGTYLAACVVYASVIGKSPVGNTYNAGLPADVAEYLQQVAAETASEFAGK